MADTAKVLDMINNARQMVTDAVEKVSDAEDPTVGHKCDMERIAGEAAGPHAVERPDQTDPRGENCCGRASCY